ncbi:hypothetical protein [Black pepper virus B]|nr:hypothetical protein [Black pepper virus B]
MSSSSSSNAGRNPRNNVLPDNYTSLQQLKMEYEQRLAQAAKEAKDAERAFLAVKAKLAEQPEKEQQLVTFGKVSLPVLPEDSAKRYIPLEALGKPNTQQQALLDAIWISQTKRQKLDACCALQYYFTKVQMPPQGKGYSYYALSRGAKPGIYRSYATLCAVKGENPYNQFKGFYSFDEAKAYMQQNHRGPYYVEHEPRPTATVEDHIQDLKQQILILQKEVRENQEYQQAALQAQHEVHYETIKHEELIKLRDACKANDKLITSLKMSLDKKDQDIQVREAQIAELQKAHEVSLQQMATLHEQMETMKKKKSWADQCP